MNSWLKLIGSSDRPVTGHPWYGDFKEETIGFRRAGRPSIRNGDHLFLYAPGGSKSIFALAEAQTDPVQDTNYNPRIDDSCRWMIRLRYLIILPVESGISIKDASLPVRNLSNSVTQQSHIKLSSDEYKHIYNILLENTTLGSRGNVVDTEALIQWYWSVFQKPTYRNKIHTDGLCQCECIRFINDTDQPGLMCSFIIFSVFVDQRMYTDFQFLYDEFRAYFCFPKMYYCSGGGMVCPDDLIRMFSRNSMNMNWQDTNRIARIILLELFKWFRRYPNGEELLKEFKRLMILEVWAGFDSQNRERLLETVRQVEKLD